MGNFLSNVIKAAFATIMVVEAHRVTKPLWLRWKAEQLEKKLRDLRGEYLNPVERASRASVFEAMNRMRREAGIDPLDID